VRTGQYQPTVARVVLEVDGAVTPKVLGVESPPRVVVDVTGQGRTDSPVEARKPDSETARSNSDEPAADKATEASRPASGPVELPVSAGRGTAIRSEAGENASPKQAPSRPAPPSVASHKSSPSPPVSSPPPSAAARPPSATRPSGASPGPVTPPVAAGRGTAIRAVPPTQTASVPEPMNAARKARGIRIVIDPGHGGKDPGAKGPGGAEKDSVLDIARRLGAKLKSRLGVEVHLTRSEDTYVPLDQRKDLANRLEADMFISIHANASRNAKLFGIETYYLKNTNDRATLRLARLENGVDMLIKGSDVSTDADLNYILSDIIQGQKEADSILLANHIQAKLCGHLEAGYDSIRSLGVKQGPFLVLDGTYMPSVLVETGFVSNPSEGRRLRATAYRESVAEGIYRGIKAYLEDERVNDLT
jgi:N-acetylmuramoyl-L-alanine amidase